MHLTRSQFRAYAHVSGRAHYHSSQRRGTAATVGPKIERNTTVSPGSSLEKLSFTLDAALLDFDNRAPSRIWVDQRRIQGQTSPANQRHALHQEQSQCMPQPCTGATLDRRCDTGSIDPALDLNSSETGWTLNWLPKAEPKRQRTITHATVSPTVIT